MKKEEGLDRLIPGERGRVDGFATQAPEVRERLMEMGLTKGTTIEVIRSAPLGDPMEIEVRGYRLSLRRKEASAVIICREERSIPPRRRFRWGQRGAPENT